MWIPVISIHGGGFMELVQPIKDVQNINALKRELQKSNYKYYILCLIALNTGMRIGDIIPLKVKDFKNKTHIIVREEKTNKTRVFPINLQLREEVNKYITGLSEEDFLFPSRQKNSKGVKSHVSRVQAYRFMKKIAVELNIENFGMHSLRKSFGYYYYQQTNDLTKLMMIFNHSSQQVTKRYIGITQEEIDDSLESFFL